MPPLWDPAKAVDKLPQPYRMIDKILADIIETTLELCVAKDKQKKVKIAMHIDTVFSPHATLVAEGFASCFTTVGVAGMAVVGTTKGELCAHTARDPLQVGRHKAHETCVSALDIGHVAATGTKVVLSASRGTLAVHEVVIRTSDLRALAAVALPVDPDMPPGEAPAKIYLSTNAGHAAVCWPSGAVAVYEVRLPAFYYDTASVDRPADAPPPDLSGGALKLVLHFPVAVVRGLLVGNRVIGVCNVVWQQQQRPDKSGKSDRNHKPARGVYMYWQGCNKLALSYLTNAPDNVEASPTPASSRPTTVGAPSTGPIPIPPPQTPPTGAKGAKGAAAAAAAQPAPAAAAVPPIPALRTTPSKGWLLPLGILSSCVSENGKMLGFGLNDGTVLVWDDHFGGHTRILPRMPAAVTALAFVNGVANLLMAASADGSVYLADLNRPEDSHMSKTKLPHACSEIFFLANDPFAICVCPGNADTQPRLVWFNMQDEKLIAELSGKDPKIGFGWACLLKELPPDPVPDQQAAAEKKSAISFEVPPTPKDGAAGAKPGSSVGGRSAAQPSSSGATGDVPAPSADAPPVGVTNQPWPRWSFRDSYLIVGGPTPVSTSYRPPDEGPPPEDHLIPRDAHLYLYKVDAIARMMLPEEMASSASKNLLDRMLADLDPPKKRKSAVKMGLPDPDAPKPPPSSMRKPGSLPMGAGPEDDAGGRRHIKFNEEDLQAMLNEEQGTKLFKKETIKGGYSEGRSKQINDPSGGRGGVGKLDLTALFGPPKGGATNVPAYMQERPQSPPWHHTNPLARIHPDWEEAPVLARIMERLGSKGGGRRRRDRRLMSVASEMKGKMSKESGPKPNLIFQ